MPQYQARGSMGPALRLKSHAEAMHSALAEIQERQNPWDKYDAQVVVQRLAALAAEAIEEIRQVAGRPGKRPIRPKNAA